MPNFIALGIYFISGNKFSWNDEGIDTCFNVKCVLLGHNFDFFGGYLVVTAHYLVVTSGYFSLPGGYWWLLLVPTFSTNKIIFILGTHFFYMSKSIFLVGPLVA